jgi:hypothetical protein
MIPSFQILKVESKKYIIKRKVILLYPFYAMQVMAKNEFIGDLTHYGDYVLAQKDAEFHSLDDAYDALHQHAMIEGFPEVIVKVKDSKYLP